MLKKRIWILVLLIILALLLCGFILYPNISVKKVNVGDEQFSVPSQYKEENVSDNLVKLSSGDSVYFMTEKENNNIKYFVKKYVNLKKSADNQSVNILHLDYEGSDIYRSVVSDNSSVVHYWFVKNGKGYEIYTGTADSSSDEFIMNIIKS